MASTSVSTTPIDFYPRPPRGGRLTAGVDVQDDRFISIHALREEGDGGAGIGGVGELISIHALREEGDRNAPHSSGDQWISIHALREEGDL